MKKVITYGTFDLLHYGHINLLKRAKELGDYLVVVLSTDEFNWNMKQNVGSRKDRSLEEIFEKIENVTGKKLKIIKKVIPNNTIKTNILDISLLKKIINFKNFTDFEKGILETIKINGYKN